MSESEPRASASASETEDAERLRTELAVVHEENERLREEYERARQVSYRRTALALAGVGALAVLAAAVLDGVRDVLLVLGGVGVFGGILTWYLTPERVVTVDVGESVYRALASNAERVRDELGLRQTTVYAPTGDGVSVFVPQHADAAVPETDGRVFHSDDDARGVAWTPSGGRLVEAFERACTGPEPSTLRVAVEQLGDALVAQFEVADAVAVEVDESDADRVVVEVEGAAFGSLSKFDHPAVSVLATGAARALGEPIEATPVDETTVALELAA